MSAIGFDDARHFLSRTGFGGSPAEIARTAKLTRVEAVDGALASMKRQPHTLPPDWVDDPLPPRKELKRLMKNKKEVKKLLRTRAMDLKAWWLVEMTKTPSPLTERMTLFWHGHFVSSLQKVRRPTFLYRQNRLLRAHAGGNFRTLTQSVAKDPAMVLYLDAQKNRKGKPNENFARELLELFTLGEGVAYTERDIKEAARAFTGWRVDRFTGEFEVKRRAQDRGAKTFLGQRGNHRGEDIIDITLNHADFGPYLVTKLWREFIDTNPSRTQIAKASTAFRANHEISPLLRSMLLSDAFWAADNRGTRIKSPVEYLVGLVRVLGIRGLNAKQLIRGGRGLGQDVFNPPNVKGWPGGTAWIDASTLLRRQMIARGVRKLDSAAADDPEAWLGVDSAHLVEACARVLLPVSPVQVPLSEIGPNNLGQLLLDPAFQLA